MGETLHRSPRNAENFRIKRRAVRLVPPDGGFLVLCLSGTIEVNPGAGFSLGTFNIRSLNSDHFFGFV